MHNCRSDMGAFAVLCIARVTWKRIADKAVNERTMRICSLEWP